MHKLKDHMGKIFIKKNQDAIHTHTNCDKWALPSVQIALKARYI